MLALYVTKKNGLENGLGVGAVEQNESPILRCTHIAKEAKKMLTKTAKQTGYAVTRAGEKGGERNHPMPYGGLFMLKPCPLFLFFSSSNSHFSIFQFFKFPNFQFFKLPNLPPRTVGT